MQGIGTTVTVRDFIESLSVQPAFLLDPALSPGAFNVDVFFHNCEVSANVLLRCFPEAAWEAALAFIHESSQNLAAQGFGTSVAAPGLLESLPALQCEFKKTVSFSGNLQRRAALRRTPGSSQGRCLHLEENRTTCCGAAARGHKVVEARRPVASKAGLAIMRSRKQQE